jgi:hypothetical protein
MPVEVFLFCYAEGLYGGVIRLSVIFLGFIMLSVGMLNVVMLGVVALCHSP